MDEVYYKLKLKFANSKRRSSHLSLGVTVSF